MNSKYVRNLGEKNSLQRQNQSNKSVTYRLRFIFVQFHSKCQGIPNNIIVVICGIHNDRIFIFTKPAKIVYINYINSRLLDIRISRCFFVFFQPPSEREQNDSSNYIIRASPPSPKGITPALTPSSSYHGSPELGRRSEQMNGYSHDNAMDIHHMTSQIEHAFPASSYADE